MEQNEEDRIPAAGTPEPSGGPCGCGGGKGSNKIVVALWVALLLGGFSWVSYSCQKNKIEAERLLNEAQMLYGQRDFVASTECLRKSAELGNVWAQVYYGGSLKNGIGTEQDMAAAVKWLRRAADKKCAMAAYELAVCYENGEGVERDLDEAEVWYKKALDDSGYASSARSSLDRIAQQKAVSGEGAD